MAAPDLQHGCGTLVTMTDAATPRYASPKMRASMTSLNLTARSAPMNRDALRQVAPTKPRSGIRAAIDGICTIAVCLALAGTGLVLRACLDLVH